MRLWNRSFAALLGAHAWSNLGDGIRRAAFPLLAATLTRDPMLVAGLTFALTVPWLVFGLHAGAIADRVDRRRILVVSSVARALLLALLALAVATGTASLAVLYAIAFVVGLTEVAFDTTAQAVVPAAVGRHALEPANARIATSEIVGNEFVGPPLGGALFAFAIVAPFLSIAGMALMGSALILLMRGDFRPLVDPHRPKRTMIAEIREGLAWLARHEVLRAVTVVAAVMAFVDTAGFAVLVLYAADELAVNEIGFGVLVAAIGAGGVVGSLLSGRIARGRRARPVMITAAAALAVSMAGLAVARSTAVAFLALFLGGLGYGLWGVVSLTLRQRLTPDGMLARAGAGHRLLALGSVPLGALAGGFVAQTLGLRATYAAGAAVLAVTTVACARIINRKRFTAALAAAE